MRVRVTTNRGQRCSRLCRDGSVHGPYKVCTECMAQSVEMERDAVVRTHRGHLMRLNLNRGPIVIHLGNKFNNKRLLSSGRSIVAQSGRRLASENHQRVVSRLERASADLDWNRVPRQFGGNVETSQNFTCLILDLKNVAALRIARRIHVQLPVLVTTYPNRRNRSSLTALGRGH